MKTLRLLIGLVCLLSVASAEEFMRAREDKRGTQHLDIAVKTFEVGDGEDVRRIQLVGVSHIGTKRYYDQVQALLNKGDLVLYEGVDADRESMALLKTHAEKIGRNHVQASAGRALGLEFQLFHIDYNQEHFRNSDVTTDQLRALFEGLEMPDGTKGEAKEADELLKQMQAGTVGSRLISSMLGMVEKRPEWGRGLRWSMVMVMGNLQGDLAEVPGLPPDMKRLMIVLIEKRNEVVMHDVKDALEEVEPGKTVVVFYGAAHLPDFEQRFADELDARLTKTEWLTAFSGNLRFSGLNVVQRGMLQAFMEQQVAAMQDLLKVAEPSAEEPEAPDDQSQPESR